MSRKLAGLGFSFALAVFAAALLPPLGLFLAAGMVVLGYMLDDTISNADDMESRTGLKVLASLPVDTTEYDGARQKKRKKKSNTSNSSSKKRAV